MLMERLWMNPILGQSDALLVSTLTLGYHYEISVPTNTQAEQLGPSGFQVLPPPGV
jgi:hypothetical protein